jgi:anti-anti-sigma factor
MPPLAITSHTMDSAVILTVSGEIDLSNSGILYMSLSKTLARGVPVVLDMTGVGFIDSRGLAALLQARREETGSRAQVLLTIPSPPVARLFDLAGTDGMFPTFHSRAEAIAALGAPQAATAIEDQ